MKIGILGTRGIPNRYGGFEQFAEVVSRCWVEKGHEVMVYCGHNHEYKDPEYQGIKRISIYDPEYRMGTAGQFFYDLGCILDSRKRDFDILLQLGYTSSSVWGFLLPRQSRIITNMDGLEWKRSKYSPKVQWFLRQAENWAIKTSDVLVADSVGIEQYLLQKYGKPSAYIPYGAEIPDPGNPAEVLEKYGLEPFSFNMILARMEPENNIEMILQGICASATKRQTLGEGSTKNTFGRRMEKQFSGKGIRFIGPNYNKAELDILRNQCYLYYHGHSVGGTNPSLLEAMACGALISAHRNEFNRHILGEKGLYFSSAEEVAQQQHLVPDPDRQALCAALQNEILQRYTWEKIAEDYLQLFEKSLKI